MWRIIAAVGLLVTLLFIVKLTELLSSYFFDTLILEGLEKRVVFNIVDGDLLSILYYVKGVYKCLTL